jgi:hypothetical protein
MHEMLAGSRLVEADGERSENGFPVMSVILARQGFVHMLETSASGGNMARHECVVGTIVGKSFKRGQAMFGRHVPDVFHPGADIDRLQARDAFLDLGNAFADPGADDGKRIGSRHR